MTILSYLRKIFSVIAITVLVGGSFFLGGVPVLALTNEEIVQATTFTVNDVKELKDNKAQVEFTVTVNDLFIWTALEGNVGTIQVRIVYSKDHSFNDSTDNDMTLGNVDKESLVQKFRRTINGLENGKHYYLKIEKITGVFSSNFTLSESVYEFTYTGDSTASEMDQGNISTNDRLADLIDANRTDGMRCTFFRWTMTGCILSFTQTVYGASTGLLSIVGEVFDSFAAFSISSPIYRDVSFVNIGWKLVRDLSNIVFIFALLIAAIQLILNVGKNTESTIKNVIVIALLINFSLFICRVVIDGGNILARVFYNQISVTQGNDPNAPNAGDPETAFNTDRGLVEKKSLSLGLARGLSLQNVISQPTINSMKKSNFFNAYTFILLFILGIIINLTAAWFFLLGALLFVVRVVGLWVAMIFAPGAFILYLIPGLYLYVPEATPKAWWKALFSYAFLAPVFLFFIFLVITLMNTHFLSSVFTETAGKGFIPVLLSMVFPFIVIIMILMRGLDITKELSGKMGKAIIETAGKVAGTAVGLAGGVAMGGVAKVTQAGAGFVGNKILQNETLQDAKDKKGLAGWAARRALGAGDKMKKSDFDMRTGVVGGALSKGLGKYGINLDQGALKSVGLDKSSTKGGAEAVAERRKDEQISSAKAMLGGQEKMQDKKRKEYDDTYNKDLEEANKKAKDAGKALNKQDFDDNYVKGIKFDVKAQDGSVLQEGFQAQEHVETGKDAVNASKLKLADVLDSGDNFVNSTQESYSNIKKKYEKGDIEGSDRSAAGAGIATTGAAGVTTAAAATLGLAPVAAIAAVSGAQGVMEREGDSRAAKALRDDAKKTTEVSTDYEKLAALLEKAKFGATTAEGMASDRGAIDEMIAVLKLSLGEQRNQSLLARKEYIEKKNTHGENHSETMAAKTNFIAEEMKYEGINRELNSYKNYDRNKKATDEKKSKLTGLGGSSKKKESEEEK